MAKSNTIALVVSRKGEASEGAKPEEGPVLVEALSDDDEIKALEEALKQGHPDPLQLIHDRRVKVEKEEEEFGDYVEDLLTQPFVHPEIRAHGLRWMRSKIRIEDYQKIEQEAASTIAGYAFKLYSSNPSKTDFFLAGPRAQVRIRVFELGAFTQSDRRAA